MDKLAGFDLAISEIKDVASPSTQHPLVTIAKFVFADDKPNGNRQAVPYSEFENIKKTAIGMPVKLRFNKITAEAEDHPNAVPVGVIRGIEENTLEDGTHQLIAEAAIWLDEFPEEVAYLKEAFAAGKGPGASYELRYRDPEIKDGIEYLKNVVTSAVAFVKNPAYGSRTHLLALSSIGDDTKRNNEIVQLAASIVQNARIDDSKNKGGNQMDKDKELEEAKTALASKDKEIETLRAELGTIQTEKESLTNELNEIRLASTIETRLRKYSEAGFKVEGDAVDLKKKLFGSFNDEQFDAYLSDLAALKPAPAAAPAPAAPAVPASAALAALASAQMNAVPKLEFEETSLESLKGVAKALARPHNSE